MNYEQMSDFEIEKAVVHVALGEGNFDFDEQKEEVYFAGMDGGEFLPNGYFNPCKSWHIAGPIIESNRINLTTDASEHGKYRWWTVSSDDGGHSVNYVDRPLRAAMIVFLMMQKND